MMDDQMKAYLEQRLQDIRKARDEYLAQANQQLAGFAGQLAEIENLLKWEPVTATIDSEHK